MTQTPTAPVFPPGRYGRRREPRRTPRWIPVTLLVAIVLAALYLAVSLYGRYGQSPYEATVNSFGEITDSSITVTFAVHKSGGGPATCRVQAKDRSAAEVGYAEVAVPAGKDVSVRYKLHTSRRPFAVDVLSCRAA
jgi:hypothetical protein